MALYCKIKTLKYYKENPNPQTIPYKQALGNTVEEELPFNRNQNREVQPSATNGWRMRGKDENSEHAGQNTK